MESGKNQVSWSLMCRICLKSTDSDMKYIFDGSCLSEDVVTKIIKCGGIPVDIMDGLPDKICSQCLLDLDIAYRFRSVCQESYYQLHQVLNSQELAEKKCEDLVLEELKQEPDSNDYDTNYESYVTPPNVRRDSFDTIFLSDEAIIDQEFTHDAQPGEATFSEERVNDEGVAVAHRNVIIKTEPSAKNGMKRLRKGRLVNPTTTYICYCCGNLYKSQSKLSQHIKLHNDEKPHECEICKKKFAQAAQLSRHMNSHTGNRPYKCKYCPSSFADPSTCIKHQRIHTNDRPFKCLECGKAFAYSNVLKVHQKTHTGEKPFSCSICEKKFTQLHHKKSHERTHSNYARSRAFRDKTGKDVGEL